ncbi:MAG: multidrug effflux MFS transporter [Rhodospirillales bacterium]|nr:multidrug effflux MFS transporter [Rhodospirillales bacterium]
MLQEQNPSPKRPTLAILVVITMGSALAMNIILPSLPAIQESFKTDYATVQLTLTLFLAGLAIAQLIYGPLSDRYGRRPIALIGLGLFIIGTTACLLAPSIETMIMGRILQAVGGCAGVVIGRAMVRDLYDTDQAAVMIAYLTMAVVVVPTLGPMLGGYLEEWYSWTASFVFILIMNIVFFIAAFFKAHETLPPPKRHKAHFLEMFGSFNQLFRNPTFAGYACQVSFCTAAFFAFLGGSPYVMINLMGSSPAKLGLYFVYVSVFYIIGNFGTAKLAKKVGVLNMARLGTLIALLGGGILLITDLMIGLNPITFFGIMSLIALGNGFCISSGMAGAIGADPHRVGAAAGLAGSMQVGFGAASTYIAGSLLAYYKVTSVPLISVMFACCVLAMLSLLLVQKPSS